MELIKWKGDPNTTDDHKCAYRWIEDKEEQEEWIRKHWEVKDD